MTCNTYAFTMSMPCVQWKIYVHRTCFWFHYSRLEIEFGEKKEQKNNFKLLLEKVNGCWLTISSIAAWIITERKYTRENWREGQGINGGAWLHNNHDEYNGACMCMKIRDFSHSSFFPLFSLKFFYFHLPFLSSGC